MLNLSLIGLSGQYVWDFNIEMVKAVGEGLVGEKRNKFGNLANTIDKGCILKESVGSVTIDSDSHFKPI